MRLSITIGIFSLLISTVTLANGSVKSSLLGTQSSKPNQSTMTPIPGQSSGSLERLKPNSPSPNESIGKSMQVIQRTFPDQEKRGSLDIDNETGTISFNYVSGGVLVRSICEDGNCRSAGQAVSCGENGTPNVATGSCSCDEGYRPTRMDGSGICISACPSGTTPDGNGMCACNNEEGTTISYSGSVSSCDSDINAGEDCGAEPGQFSTEAQQQAYNACTERNLARQIEEQREENRVQAEAQAQSQAVSSRDQNISQAEEGLRQNCHGQVQGFVNSCRTISVQSLPNIEQINSSSAGSAEKCQNLQGASTSAIQQLKQEFDRCITQYNSLSSSCVASTDPISGSNPNAVTVANNPNGLPADVSATVPAGGVSSGARAGSINETGALNDANHIFSQLSAKSDLAQQELAKIESASAQCVADFENNQEDNSPATQDRWGSLAKTASGALGGLSQRGSLGGGSYSDELGSGGGGGRGSAASTPGYSPGGGGSYAGGSSSRGGLGGSRPTTGGIDDSSMGASNKNSNMPFPGAGGSNNSRASNGAGVPRGGGGGLQFSNDDTNFSVKDENGQRVYTSAKERNLVMGFKKAKPGGGGYATYSPGDFTKYGKKGMRKKLKEARDKYGAHTPLLFKDGKFVRDLLQMKESLAWQRRNNMQKRKLAGLNDVDKKDQVQDVFHQCIRFEECYSESRYSIFKLHHHKVRKSLYPGK